MTSSPSARGLGRVLELLAGDLVEEVGQARLDDVVGDALAIAGGRRARGPLHRCCCQRVECGDVAQHAHRLQRDIKTALMCARSTYTQVRRMSARGLSARVGVAVQDGCVRIVSFARMSKLMSSPTHICFRDFCAGNRFCTTCRKEHWSWEQVSNMYSRGMVMIGLRGLKESLT